MVRMVVVIILSCLFFSFGETGNSNSNKITYLGRWVGDPTKLLENLGFFVFSIGADARFCVYGDINASKFINKALDCVEQFTKNAKRLCNTKDITHYVIANLRISHSKTNEYSHFLIVYGDVLCLTKIKGK